MCWTLRTTSGGTPIGITGLAVMSRRGWRTWARGVRPVVISTTSGETSPTTICALAAASASLRAGATGHRPRGRHEDASRLPGCRRRARQAVVLEGIGDAFDGKPTARGEPFDSNSGLTRQHGQSCALSLRPPGVWRIPGGCRATHAAHMPRRCGRAPWRRGAPRPYVVHIGLTPHRWGGFSRENWEFETHRYRST